MLKSRVITGPSTKAILAALAALACLLVAAPAHAAFPGTNGLIAFGSDRAQAPPTPGSFIFDATQLVSIFGTYGFGDTALYTVAPTGGAATLLTDSAGPDHMPSWSPDGQRIAFVSGGSACDGHGCDISVLKVADGTVTKVADDGVDPSFSPDGSKVLFARTPSSSYGYGVYVANADGSGGEQKLINMPWHSPVWSPDGGLIAVTEPCCAGSYHGAIWVANPDGTGLRKLTPGSNEGEPDWSPDGQRLAFARQGAADGIFTVARDGTGERRVTDPSNNPVNANLLSGVNIGAEFHGEPAYSPQGDKITFITSGESVGKADRGEVFVINADGTGTPVNLSNSDAADREPNWQPLPPPATPGSILVDELRFHGPSGVQDEYVELYNASTAPIDVTGWHVDYKDAAGAVQSVMLPAATLKPRQHLLLGGATYSLSGYAARDATIASDIPSNGGVKLVAADGSVIDRAGFSSADPDYREGSGAGEGLTPVGNAAGQYAWVRAIAEAVPSPDGKPVDTGNNKADFRLVAVGVGKYSTRSGPPKVATERAIFGAPGPQGVAAPVMVNEIVDQGPVDLLDATAQVNVLNYVSSKVKAYRRLTNTSAQAITRLRLRITELDTYNSYNTTTSSSRCILRLESSTAEPNFVDSVTTRPFKVKGMTLEQPPTQSAGGGLNSSLAIDFSDLPDNELKPGQSINVVFQFQKDYGTYCTPISLTFNREALPAP